MPGAGRSTLIKDLGHIDADRCRFDRVCCDPRTYRTMEAAELAAAKAERAVPPFPKGRATVPMHGRAAVGLRFLADGTLSTFERCDALIRMTALQMRRLVRWRASAQGDALLEDHLAFGVANHLETDFEGLFQAPVSSYRDHGTRSGASGE